MNGEVKEVLLGNSILVLCSLCYLFWWIAAFRPGSTTPALGKGLLLFFAAAAGVGALILIYRGFGGLPQGKEAVPSSYLLWGGIATYLLLLFVTWLLLKRQVTSELFLIIGWAVLELAIINRLYGIGTIAGGLSITLASLIGAATVVSLVCYVLYYRLDVHAGYIDGMIPLITETAVMAVLVFSVRMMGTGVDKF